MSLGLPRAVAPAVTARAIGRSARMMSVVCLVVPLIALVASVDDVAGADGIVAVVGIVAMLAILISRATAGSAVFSALYQLVGLLVVFCCARAAVGVTPIADPFFVTLIETALLLAAGTVSTTRRALLQVAATTLLAESARALGRAMADEPFRVEPMFVIVLVAVVAVILLSARDRRPARGAQLWLQAASRDDEVSRVRKELELQAAAFMHDTVLGHLAAISAAEPGALTDHARTQISRDIGLLVGQKWLAASTAPADPGLDAWETSPLREAIGFEHGDELAVAVSGDLNSVERLTIDREHALALAVRQCLVNVRRHSGVHEAEVVVLSRRDAVSVMVVDAGRGFDPAATPEDRMGISRSIVGRIQGAGGSVDIWSTPGGGGTSILISLPVDDEEPTQDPGVDGAPAIGASPHRAPGSES